jgi:hypothetical protein
MMRMKEGKVNLDRGFIGSGVEVCIGSGICGCEAYVEYGACGVLDMVQYMLALKWMNVLESQSDELKKLLDGDG